MSEPGVDLEKLLQEQLAERGVEIAGTVDVGALVAAAREAWPSVDVPDTEVVRYWAMRCSGSLDALRTVDLYLACACERGDDGAVAAFQSAYADDLRAAIATIDRSPAFADDVYQRLLEHLFVAKPDGRTKISNYNGTGELYSWCRVVAIRFALASARKASREVAVAAVDLSDAVDPTLEHLKAKYRDDFKRAFGQVLAGLSPSERTMLRLNLVDGLSIDELGHLHGVHRATAARWLQKLRDQIAERTKAILQEQLELTDRADVESVIRLISSQLDISVRRHLRSRSGTSVRSDKN